MCTYYNKWSVLDEHTPVLTDMLILLGCLCSKQLWLSKLPVNHRLACGSMHMILIML